LDGVTIAQEFCLGEGCYTFNIFDSFGDGLYGSQYGSCSFDGDYSITDSEGNVLVEMTAPNADYGDSATHNFCIESDEVPCENPYPMAQNLNSQVLANGVLLTWDPIIGSFNCQVNGGIVGNPGNASFLTNEPNSGSFFVPQGALISGNEYRWRVRCACTFQIRGPFTPFNFFSWGAPGSSFSGILSSETVFPNPVANEKLNVQLDFAGAPVTASFYDMQGRLIKQEFLGDTATMITQFDVSDFQSGVYILQLNNGSETVTHKFVKK
jgi:hypothetical protein